MKHINNTMNDNEKIMNIISKVFNATSPETAVTLEQVIEKGIEMGVAEDYPRGKEDGQPLVPTHLSHDGSRFSQCSDELGRGSPPQEEDAQD